MDDEAAFPAISPPPPMDPTATTSTFLGEASSLFDWSEFLDLDLIDPFAAVAEAAPPPPPPPETTMVKGSEEDPSRVRKRDPMLVCPNFLAGLVPCACPELDAQLAREEEEMALVGPGKKRARTTAGSGARCQVPGCEADISELKGYHKRHRVCLRCATASVVQLDGESKRYCQQCGKFHLISDFDEGRRSCRRKLERHNTRRRRKPHDAKGGVEKEHKQIEEINGDDDVVKEDTSLSNENVEKETLLESEGQLSNPSSVNASHDAQNNGPVTFAATSSETQTNREKENQNSSQSPPSYCDNKTTFSSMCPTNRISFKLYDWNPAEFPRRLRHQIFQWLANMPVELEGYIRPGCTIFTVFIAMPKSMWSKLFEGPAAYLRDLVDSPGIMLHRFLFILRT